MINQEKWLHTVKINNFKIYEYGTRLQDQYPDYKGEVFICKNYS